VVSNLQGASPERPLLRASMCARRPTPRLVVSVNAVKVRGFNRGLKGGTAQLAPRYNTAL